MATMRALLLLAAVILALAAAYLAEPRLTWQRALALALAAFAASFVPW